ncbi:PKD domain-containing protein [Emticicia sp. BO119]|uniref:PKD domain-containing protein n=1 Tax=Emticicia sp. BO119 TaxID=2757768 RepID=UPI0015F03E8A|nr:PKD domain-containing protein [Emticicia sp. BO119]MBA4850503.1 PKD domain-containing protein [Emticicia sp. BO119]
MNKLFLTNFLAALILVNACKKEEIPVLIADFTYKETTNGLVYFYNTSQNANTYEWDFGTGKQSTKVTPFYRFTENKEYLITLTAKGQTGQNSTAKTITIHTIPATGYLLFWSDFQGNPIKIYVNEHYIGVLNKYVNGNLVPDCDAEGFVTVNLPAGIYPFAAKQEGVSGLAWGGFISIKNGLCQNMLLRK